MANHKGPVPDWLSSSYIQDVLQKGLKSSNIAVKSIDVQPGSKVGDNYACQVFRIKVILNNDEKLSIIGKYLPQSQLLDSLELDVFGVEARFLQNMLPFINQTLGHSDIGPDCLYVDNDHNIFFMDDLVAKGFSLQKRGVFLDLDQAVMVVESLASMHGASFFALQKDPSIRNTYPKSLWSSEPKEPLLKIFQNGQNVFEKNIDKFGLSASQTKKILSLMDWINKDFCKVCDIQEDHLNFMLHGDAWLNNMMFRLEDGKAKAVKLLDFQIYNYNCFANDLQYFIFSSVRSDVIFEHLDLLIEKYFEKLRAVAPDIPNLTLARVKSEFAERYYFGYLLTLCIRPFIVSEVPVNMEEILDGKTVDMGYLDPSVIADLKRFMCFFEKVGAI